MPLSEADTRSKLIDPAIHARGWTEDLIRREETAGAIELLDGRPSRRKTGRTDYTLRIKVEGGEQPVAVALIEAKAEDRPPAHGLEQGKLYASSCRRLNVPFVFSSNGHLFVEYDRFTGMTSASQPLAVFPSPGTLRARYEQGMGFSLGSAAARPLLTGYPANEQTRHYYQDAAIRAVLEKLARCTVEERPQRALLSLATGSGKTFVAVNLLRRIAAAGQLRRALFVCDRDELRSQGAAAFARVFGSDAARVSAAEPMKNARILVATYQTLGVEGDDAEQNFLTEHYPEDYFSHIIIDECHRSAFGKWSQVLTRNWNAAQIGLTATPRELDVSPELAGARLDLEVTADNLTYFGPPVYEYDLAQGIEDGYLAACEIIRRDIFLDDNTENERESGVSRDDLEGKRLVDVRTGELLSVADVRGDYDASALDRRLVSPERVRAMANDLFQHLVATGGPEQKTIVFCQSDHHADDVAIAMNNLYAEWCAANARAVLPHYAFKCTAASSGGDFVADLRGSSRSFFIATTVELLTTGVDVPVVRNIVFFKYVRSPIAFYQMVGRGTRIDAASNKLMFRVYDYTDATRLFGEAFITKIAKPRESATFAVDPTEPERVIEVAGFDVHINDAGRFIVTTGPDGKAVPVTVEEYKQRIAEQLVQEAPTLDAFRQRWITPPLRHEMLEHLPEKGRSASLVRELEGMRAYDLYDVLAELGYGLAPRTKAERTAAFGYKHAGWLDHLPPRTAATLKAMAAQFARDGTEGLENPQIFGVPEVAREGGVKALEMLGKPADVLHETKARMFAT